MSSPVSFACSSIHNVDAEFGQIPAIESEQNWQAKAHSFLRLEVADTTTDIWLYRLETVFMPQTNVATYVRYVPKKGGTQVVTTSWKGGKRDVPAPAAAVFGIMNTGAHLHLDIPYGLTAEETLHLHDQGHLAPNNSLSQRLLPTENFYNFELHHASDTARRLLKAARPKLRSRQGNIKFQNQLAGDKAAALENRNATSPQPAISHGPTHQDPQSDPPVPILQIGLEYLLQDVSYGSTNVSLKHVERRQNPKKSCEWMP